MLFSLKSSTYNDFDVFPSVNGNFHGQGVIMRRLYHHRFISSLSAGDTAVKQVQKLVCSAHSKCCAKWESGKKNLCCLGEVLSFLFDKTRHCLWFHGNRIQRQFSHRCKFLSMRCEPHYILYMSARIHLVFPFHWTWVMGCAIFLTDSNEIWRQTSATMLDHQ